jgi:ribosomal protein S27E
MSAPIQVTCDVCGEKAAILKNVHVDAAGKRVEWPKAAVRPEGLYFALNCPECGEREQLVARQSDAD